MGQQPVPQSPRAAHRAALVAALNDALARDDRAELQRVHLMLEVLDKNLPIDVKPSIPAGRAAPGAP